jgi:hypothetical protein
MEMILVAALRSDDRAFSRQPPTGGRKKTMAKKLKGKVAVAARLPKGFAEKSANVNGVRINYKIVGRGPVVVLLTAIPRRATCGCG